MLVPRLVSAPPSALCATRRPIRPSSPGCVLALWVQACSCLAARIARRLPATSNTYWDRRCGRGRLCSSIRGAPTPRRTSPRCWRRVAVGYGFLPAVLAGLVANRTGDRKSQERVAQHRCADDGGAVYQSIAIHSWVLLHTILPCSGGLVTTLSPMTPLQHRAWPEHCAID
jgi:hypothetical protein